MQILQIGASSSSLLGIVMTKSTEYQTGNLLLQEGFMVEVERFENLLFINGLIDVYVSGFCQKGKVDYSTFILFVVGH